MSGLQAPSSRIQEQCRKKQEKMMAIVATLMAGVIGTEHYGLDEKGQVFVLDPKGNPLQPPVSEPLASKVREAMRRGDARSSPDKR
jgi:hypothetical protein